MSDLSSAEEEATRRDRVRKKQRRQPTAVSQLVKPKELDNVASYDDMDAEPAPVLRTMQEFAREHTHTVPTSDTMPSRPSCEAAESYLIQTANSLMSLGSSASAAAAAASGSASDGLIPQIQERVAEEHRRQSRVVPKQVELYQSLVDQLYRPVFYNVDGITADLDTESATMENALRVRRVRLPLMTAALESELLAEAGRFVHDGEEYDFPPCLYGDKCVGMQMEFPLGMPLSAWGGKNPQRFILTSLMYEEEYTAFIRDKTPPPCLRPCVACCRYSIVELVGFIRSLRASAAADPTATKGAPSIRVELEQHVYQIYHNLRDQPNGYFSQYMITPHMGDEPLIDPICKLSKESLRLCRLRSGRRYLDQSAMVYQRPSVGKPRIGESLQGFSSGADRR